VPGRRVALASVLACLAILSFRIGAGLLGDEGVGLYPIPWYSSKLVRLEGRERVMDQLRGRGGKHLVVVRYQSGHSPHQEYVYNNADIDGSDIIWARELAAPEMNRPLLEYYRERSIWLFRPDESEELVPYGVANPPF
jgi:hypothetical protein